MVGFEIKIPEFDKLSDLLEDIARDIQILKNRVNPCTAWYSLKEACSLKGVKYKTLCNKPKLQPAEGKPDAIISGRRMWRSETIISWLEVTDQDLESSL